MSRGPHISNKADKSQKTIPLHGYYPQGMKAVMGAGTWEVKGYRAVILFFTVLSSVCYAFVELYVSPCAYHTSWYKRHAPAKQRGEHHHRQPIGYYPMQRCLTMAHAEVRPISLPSPQLTPSLPELPATVLLLRLGVPFAIPGETSQLGSPEFPGPALPGCLQCVACLLACAMTLQLQTSLQSWNWKKGEHSLSPSIPTSCPLSLSFECR